MLKRFVSSMSDAFEINKATLTGSIDTIVIERENGSLHSTPFHVRFGKLKVLHTKRVVLHIEVNGVDTGVTMKLGRGGEGYFEFDSKIDQDDSSINSDSGYFSSDGEEIVKLEKQKSEKKIKDHWFWGNFPHKRSQSNDGARYIKEKLEKDKGGFMERFSRIFGNKKNKKKGYANNENEFPLIPPAKLSQKAVKDVATNQKKVEVRTPERKKQEIVPEKAQEQESTIEPKTITENQVGLSLCGHLISNETVSEDVIKLFEKNLVCFEEFRINPQKVLTNPHLIIRIHDSLYLPKEGIPEIISLLTYNRALDIEPAKKEGSVELQPPVVDPQEKDSFDKESTSKTSRKLKKRSVRPSKEMLALLNLKPGKNTVRYVAKGTMKEETWTDASIYLWKSSVKIVISDIDGTITKSDVLGHIMPMMGKDWSQEGITSLFTNIHLNGYKIVYLTARAIGQASITKNYLKSVKQGTFKLPDGPMFMSSDRLFHAFKREVILKKPEIFKIAVLRDINAIFGRDNKNPIIAGFGNKDSDAISYKAIGITNAKIFIVNPAGTIFQMNSNYKWSYNKLNNIVDMVFPNADTLDGNEVLFNDVNYWNQDYKENKNDVNEILQEIYQK